MNNVTLLLGHSVIKVVNRLSSLFLIVIDQNGTKRKQERERQRASGIEDIYVCVHICNVLRLRFRSYKRTMGGCLDVPWLLVDNHPQFEVTTPKMQAIMGNVDPAQASMFKAVDAKRTLHVRADNASKATVPCY